MLPKIVIVGRPNVGKSSLLNMLAHRRVSIVDPTAGVTRDRISTTIEIPADSKREEPYLAELIDTGGYGVHDVEDLTPQIEQQISRALAEADLILFVIDAQSGLLPLDFTVAQLLRTSNTEQTPIVLVANKVDAQKHEAEAWEALQLGFDEPVMISATTGHNQFELYDAIRHRLDFKRFEESEGEDEGERPQGVKLAIVGKRNAGKSTLVNALAGDERVIVSELEGTTRDAIDVQFEIEGHRFIAIDTAGVRKRKSFANDIEFYSHHRTLRSVRRADVCLLLIDAAVPVSQVDRQLVNEILRHHRPTVIVINKWDLAEKQYTQEQYVEYLDQALKGLPFAPMVFVSAKNQEGITDVLAMAKNLYAQAGHRVSTSKLNELIEQIANERGPRAKGGKPAKIFYATQLDVHPPTIALFVNDPELFDNSYQRYLLNRFHDELPFAEVPIRLVIRGRERMGQKQRN